jgi:hypothetical protein
MQLNLAEYADSLAMRDIPDFTTEPSQRLMFER